MKSLRTQQDRDNIIGRINGLRGDEKPQWGKMTVNQMVSHLVQSGEMPFSAAMPDQSSLASRTIIKKLVLYVLPVPKNVKTSRDLNQQENGRKPTDLNDDKALATQLIERLGSLPLDHSCTDHPFFGRMTAQEWALLSYKHFDHHLRQFGK